MHTPTRAAIPLALSALIAAGCGTTTSHTHGPTQTHTPSTKQAASLRSEPASHRRLTGAQVIAALQRGSAQVQAIAAQCAAQVGTADRSALLDCLHAHGLQGGTP